MNRVLVSQIGYNMKETFNNKGILTLSKKFEAHIRLSVGEENKFKVFFNNKEFTATVKNTKRIKNDEDNTYLAFLCVELSEEFKLSGVNIDSNIDIELIMIKGNIVFCIYKESKERDIREFLVNNENLVKAENRSILNTAKKILQGSSIRDLLEIMDTCGITKLVGPNDWYLDSEGNYNNKLSKAQKNGNVLNGTMKNIGDVFNTQNDKLNPYYTKYNGDKLHPIPYYCNVPDDLHNDYTKDSSNYMPTDKDNNYIKDSIKYGSTNYDRLGRDKLAGAITTYLASCKNDRGIFAICSKWGNGKSSLIKNIESKISNNNKKFKKEKSDCKKVYTYMARVNANLYDDKEKIWKCILREMQESYTKEYDINEHDINEHDMKGDDRKNIFKVIYKELQGFCRHLKGFYRRLKIVCTLADWVNKIKIILLPLFFLLVSIISIRFAITKNIVIYDLFKDAKFKAIFIYLITSLTSAFAAFKYLNDGIKNSNPLIKKIMPFVRDNTKELGLKFDIYEDIKKVAKLMAPGENKMILIIIDEIDRCTKQTIVDVFDSLHILDEIDKISVILSINTEIVANVLGQERCYDECSDKRINNGLRYIDKYVNVNIYLPIEKDYDELLDSLFISYRETGDKKSNNTNSNTDNNNSGDDKFGSNVNLKISDNNSDIKVAEKLNENQNNINLDKSQADIDTPLIIDEKTECFMKKMIKELTEENKYSKIELTPRKIKQITTKLIITYYMLNKKSEYKENNKNTESSIEFLLDCMFENEMYCFSNDKSYKSKDFDEYRSYLENNNEVLNIIKFFVCQKLYDDIMQSLPTKENSSENVAYKEAETEGIIVKN